MRRILTIALLIALIPTPVAAIYKCKVDGRTTFQDKPCEPGAGGKIDVRPSSLPTPVATVPSETPADDATQDSQEPQRSKVEDMRERAAVAEKERKGREIDHKIKIAQQKMRQLEADQAAEMAALNRKKQYATNNLAGATWENSISKEQEAVAQKYESRMANERSRIERLEAERGRL